jgi:hypothetical protein
VLPKRSDYALAKALEVPQSTIIGIKRGELHLGERASMRVSELICMGYDMVRAYVKQESSKGEEERAFWEKRAPRLQAKIGLALAAILAGNITINSEAQSHGAVQTYRLTPDDLYIMRSVRREAQGGVVSH